MQIVRLKSKDIDPEQWDTFIRKSSEGMVYSLYDFLSFIEPDWEAMIAVKDDQWQMVFPLKQSKKFGLRYFLQPKFTQFLGPVFTRYSGIQSKELQWKNGLLTALCERLKKDFHYLNFNVHPDFNYPLPFTWSKFRLSPKYTYQLELAGRNIEQLKSGILKKKIQINKATEAGVSFVKSDNPNRLLELFSKLKSKDIGHLSTQDYRQYAAAIEPLIQNNECEVIEAISPDNELLGGMILYYYENTCVYAFSVVDPIAAKLSLGHGLIWQAILRSKELDLAILDFEGSMIPHIERLFRRFGATPKAYLNIQYAKFRFLYRS
jgi:hypothetical protein